MVSLRCKMIVKDELSKLGLLYGAVNLGEVHVLDIISSEQRRLLQVNLLSYGFELMEDKKVILVEKIKNVIIEMVHYMDEMPRVKFSDYIGNKFNYEYTYLANLFSDIHGSTIEQFIIMHKIEKVKELLMYDELTLTDIAYKMHYSSVAHLSNQFKKVTGLTPSFFKKLKKNK
jgi:AraC-like DNA-binding protein